MIKFFRRFFDSKLGVPVTLGFLGLIAIAFASADITGTGMFGGVSGGDRVAVVGDTKIGTADLNQAARSGYDQVREQNPTLSMPGFIAQGGLEASLDQLLDRTAIAEFARKYGLRAGDNLVNSVILDIPGFRGPDGNFSQEIYRAAIAQQGLSDAQVRDDFGQGLLAQQALVPASFGARMPDKLVSRYAALFRERRKGTIGVVPSAVYAPTGDPTDAQLQAHYDGNREDYIRPERRVIRFATFDASAVADAAEPTDNEIAARYEENRQQYAASENRRLSQLIVPTEAAASSIRSAVRGGGSLEAAAREAGFSVAAIGPLTRAQLASQSSAAVAQAAFAAERGAIAAPARSGLGWHVIRVDEVNRIAGRNLEQAREEIAEELRAEKQRRAIAELSSSIEDRLDGGEALSGVAASLDVELRSTRPITGDGRVYGNPAETAPPELGPALQTAFQMEEGEPQIAEVMPGQLFLIFETSEIVESATAPLREIREQVVADWRRAEGMRRAREAADRILAALDGDTTLAAAMRAENVRLTDLDRINLTREELQQQAQGRVPPPLALLFSMAEGTTKKLEAPRDIGWFLVDLDDIEAGTIATDDPIFAQARSELSQILGREYSDQLRGAIRQDVGVERNETAIEAVRRQLAGES